MLNELIIAENELDDLRGRPLPITNREKRERAERAEKAGEDLVKEVEAEEKHKAEKVMFTPNDFTRFLLMK